MREFVFGAAFAAMSIQCVGRAERHEPPPATVVKAVQPIVTVPAVVPARNLEPTKVTAVAASMVGEELYACTEVTFELPEASLAEFAKISDAGVQFVLDQDLMMWLGNDSTMLGEMLTKRRGKTVSSQVRPAGTPRALSRACREQFPRPLIATCTTPLQSKIRDAGPPVDAAMQTVYYQVTGDAVMDHCIAAGSDWWEAARNSPEYTRANAEKALRELRRGI